IAAADDLLHPLGKPLYIMTFTEILSKTPIPPKPDYIAEIMDVGLQAMTEGRVAGMITYALRKDGNPDSAASNMAHGGPGHYKLGLPAGVKTEPSARGGISQVAVVDPAAMHRLGFWHRDNITDAADMGRARLELLVDGNVAWQEDLAMSPLDEWVN